MALMVAQVARAAPGAACLAMPGTVVQAVWAVTVRMVPRVLMVLTQVHLVRLEVLAAMAAQAARVVPAALLWVRVPLALMVLTETAVRVV